ncbi:hypothetical protein ACOR62_00165 [Neisseria lisongii]|uniref:Secreted protein n=1 Tax=Neisseria lisongii TaxID=2912188 RepID=A0AAW5AGZ3_9NEIS|nr:hypothetical protein [Neisseria lisongii]MCF7530579.1 hypothetical protein [Neisseria lisongii]
MFMLLSASILAETVNEKIFHHQPLVSWVVCLSFKLKRGGGPLRFVGNSIGRFQTACKCLCFSVTLCCIYFTFVMMPDDADFFWRKIWFLTHIFAFNCLKTEDDIRVGSLKPNRRQAV